MRRIRLAAAAAALTLAGLVIFPAPAACACSCVMGSEAELAAHADTIFIGVVTDAEGRSSTADMVTTEFRVRRVIKGEVAGSSVKITSPSGGEASCGLGFVEGGEYRVFAKAGQTSLCSGTHATQDAPGPQPDIDGFPVVWLAIGGGVAVAALILYFLHIRRL